MCVCVCACVRACLWSVCVPFPSCQATPGGGKGVYHVREANDGTTLTIPVMKRNLESRYNCYIGEIPNDKQLPTSIELTMEPGEFLFWGPQRSLHILHSQWDFPISKHLPPSLSPCTHLYAPANT